MPRQDDPVDAAADAVGERRPTVEHRWAGPGLLTAGRGFKIGSVAGIPVYVSPMWLLVALLTVITYGGVVQQWVPSLSGPQSYLVSALFAILLFGSVFLHELGHALVSKAFGLRVYAMSLWMLGGVTESEAESKRPGVDFLIAFAGPVINLVIGGCAVVASTMTEDATVAQVLVYQLAISNLLVALFNLLPGLPLDGGTILQAVVWAITSKKHLGTVVAGWIGRITAVGVGLLALTALTSDAVVQWGGLLLTLAIAWFLWNGASQAIRFAKVARRFPLLHAGRMARPVTLVPADLPLAEAVRRGAENGSGGVVVVDADGRPQGVLSPEAVAATPVDRRPWVPVVTASRTLQAGMVLAADLAGEDVVRAVQEHPATEYVVVDGGERIVGVLPAAVIADMLESRKSGEAVR